MNKEDIKNLMDYSNTNLADQLETELVKIEKLIEQIRTCQKFGPESLPICIQDIVTYGTNVCYFANRIHTQKQVSTMIELNSDRQFQGW